MYDVEFDFSHLLFADVVIILCHSFTSSAKFSIDDTVSRIRTAHARLQLARILAELSSTRQLIFHNLLHNNFTAKVFGGPWRYMRDGGWVGETAAQYSAMCRNYYNRIVLIESPPYRPAMRCGSPMLSNFIFLDFRFQFAGAGCQTVMSTCVCVRVSFFS